MATRMPDGSGVRREFHAPFYERPRLRRFGLLSRQSLPKRGVAAISALPLKADIHRKGRHVPKVPIGVIASDDRKRKRPPTEVAYFGFSAFMCRT